MRKHVKYYSTVLALQRRDY